MNHNSDGSNGGLPPNPKSQLQWMVQELDPCYNAGSIRYKCRQPSHTTTNNNNKHGPSWLCILTIAGLVKCTSRPRGSKREAEKAAASMVLSRWDDISLHLFDQAHRNAIPSTLVYREGEPEPHTPPRKQRARLKQVWRTDGGPVSSEDTSPAMWDGASRSEWQESDEDSDSSSSSSSYDDDASDRQNWSQQQRQRQRRKQRQSTHSTASEHNGHGTPKPPAMNLEQAFQSLAQAQRNLLQATESVNTAFRVACLTLRQTLQQQRQQGALCDFDV